MLHRQSSQSDKTGHPKRCFHLNFYYSPRKYPAVLYAGKWVKCENSATINWLVEAFKVGHVLVGPFAGCILCVNVYCENLVHETGNANKSNEHFCVFKLRRKSQRVFERSFLR
jgi:hypothetical protein